MKSPYSHSRIRCALFLMVLAGTPTWATEEVSVRDRFKLWNDCQPIGLAVEELPEDAKEIGLTKERIQTAVESRLRVAGIYDSDLIGAEFWIYVNVNVVGRGYSISFDFITLVRRPTLGYGSAAIWNSGGTGTHGGDGGFILQYVSEYTDQFINEYLRVNADACD